MKLQWQREHDEFVERVAGECYTARELVDRFNAEFHTRVTEASVHQRMRTRGTLLGKLLRTGVRRTDEAKFVPAAVRLPKVPSEPGFTRAVSREPDDLRDEVRRMVAEAMGDRAPARTPRTDPVPPPIPSVDVDLSDLSDLGPEPFVPSPPRGPIKGVGDPPAGHVPEGHEIGGVSTRTGPEGDLQQQWTKTRVAGADEPPTTVPESFLAVRTSTLQRGDGTVVSQWTSYEQAAVDRFESAKAAIREHVAEYVRAADPVAPPGYSDADTLTLYPIGDPHVGMLSWAEETGHNFDLRICERELVECFRQLVSGSPPSKKAKVKNLGDFFHAETNAQRTPTSGNKLDVDGRSQKVGKVGLRIMRTLVDAALTKHEVVEVGSLPGNHDPTLAFWIQEWLRAVYANEPRVVVEDTQDPYQYDIFGKCLFGWHHGDGAKIDDLPAIMAADVPELWGRATYRVIHTGHVHHKKVQEYRGCVVHTHRTLAPGDAWHRHSGYRSGQSLDALTYHREFGPQSTVTVGVEQVRAALILGRDSTPPGR